MFEKIKDSTIKNVVEQEFKIFYDLTEEVLTKTIFFKKVNQILIICPLFKKELDEEKIKKNSMK